MTAPTRKSAHTVITTSDNPHGLQVSINYYRELGYTCEESGISSRGTYDKYYARMEKYSTQSGIAYVNLEEEPDKVLELLRRGWACESVLEVRDTLVAIFVKYGEVDKDRQV